MGTNYYFTTNETYPCHVCKNDTPLKLHIGKKSVGWRFCFNYDRENSLLSPKDWVQFLNKTDGQLTVDNGEACSLFNLMVLIISAQSEKSAKASLGMVVIDSFDVCKAKDWS